MYDHLSLRLKNGFRGKTNSGNMLQRQRFSSCDMPVFVTKFCCGDKILFPQHVECGLNSCAIKRGQKKIDPNFQCYITCTALANSPRCKVQYVAQFPAAFRKASFLVEKRILMRRLFPNIHRCLFFHYLEWRLSSCRRRRKF